MHTCHALPPTHTHRVDFQTTFIRIVIQSFSFFTAAAAELYSIHSVHYGIYEQMKCVWNFSMKRMMNEVKCYRNVKREKEGQCNESNVLHWNGNISYLASCMPYCDIIHAKRGEVKVDRKKRTFLMTKLILFFRCNSVSSDFNLKMTFRAFVHFTQI